MKTKYQLAFWAATGMVGQRYIQLLENHPWFEIAWLAASDRLQRQALRDAAKWRLDTPLPERIAKMTVAEAQPEGAPKIHLRIGRRGHCARTGAEVCRGWLRGAVELQRLPHGSNVPLVIPRGQRPST